MNLIFKISLLSDYHIGAGYGRGIIDSVLLKDESGLPVIRGTTLSGLLRQGMWNLLQLPLLEKHRKCKRSGGSPENPYCPDENTGSMCPVCRILGTPAFPKRWNISSAKIDNSTKLITKKIVWRNRVNPRTRIAEARKLFKEEAGNQGISFVFSVNNESSDKGTLEEAAFIVAAFRMIRNLGSSRRRGKGYCRINLINAEPTPKDLKDASLLDYFLNIFKSRWIENGKLNILQEEHKPEIKNNYLSPKRFVVILLSEEPLLVANRGESGNRYHTQIYIPGYTFLGALAWRIARNCDLSDKTTWDKFILLFRRGGIKLTPLYPALKSESDVYPSVPSPLDFLTCGLFPAYDEEGHGAEGYATGVTEPKSCEECKKMGVETPLVPINKFLPLYYKDRLETVEVSLREETHITINPVSGRAKTGELYNYVAVESGQYFIGAIQIEDWVNFTNLMNLNENGEEITFELQIGKASSRGYGKVKVWLQPRDNIHSLFIGKPLNERVKDLTQPITLTFLSDTIIQDSWGRYITNLDDEELEKLLGIKVSMINAFVASKNIDGFNIHLGLPKWRDIGIAAGSSIGFKIKNPQNRSEILERFGKLERDGLGLRTDEGFGRIVFNHPLYNDMEGASSRILLPERMRTSKEKKKEVESFEERWQQIINTKMTRKLFSDAKWAAVARFLKTNTKKSIKSMKEVIINFHEPDEPLNSIIKQKKPISSKERFMEEELKSQNVLLELLDTLSRLLELEDPEIREYLKRRGIEMLADAITSAAMEVKK